MTAGKTTLEYGERVMRPRPQVSWTDAAGEHRTNIDDVVLAGSAPQAALVVDDRTVSRLHAELVPQQDGLWVRDLGSRNGTFINEMRVSEARVPHHGTLRLGSTKLTVTYDLEPTAIQMWATERFGPLVGRTAAMRQLFARLAKIAATDSSVLISGETGTGKELVARAIHMASTRREAPFVVVDCAALPESLVEAELFGHVRGAFTGAGGEREGAIEAADGGTVFLDEIGELPLSVQPKLLRALESRQVRRIGETQHRSVNVRFVSATHRDLREMVNRGAFREDLYFRIAVITVRVPALRDRVDDIPVLVEHLLPEGAKQFDESLLAQLEAQPWLGNVRELRNFVERVHALGTEEALSMTSGDAHASERRPGSEPPPSIRRATMSLAGPYREVRDRWIEQFEREYFTELLARHDRNVAAAAREAGVDRTYVYRMIRRHGL